MILIARRYSRSRMPLPDLIQEGTLGLMKATDRFDPSLGFRFTTYATWWIRDSITQALAEQTGAFGLPTRAVLQMSKLRKIANAPAHSLQRPPTFEGISDEAGIPLEETWRAFHASTGLVSLQETPASGKSRLSDVLRDRNPRAEVWSDTQEQLEARIARALSQLPFRDRQVIELRFGLGAGRAHGRLEIANIFRLSQERVRQIEEGALKRLRAPLFGVELESFL